VDGFRNGKKSLGGVVVGFAGTALLPPPGVFCMNVKRKGLPKSMLEVIENKGRQNEGDLESKNDGRGWRG
jgi:hypothetical protein